MQVSRVIGVTAIAAGDNHTVALKSDGSFSRSIVSQGDAGLREEFIRDSGLDRLLVEEFEEFWCIRENIP